MSRGKFITFEGIDGAGKSTHLAFVADCLRAAGRTVVITREPGGTPLGETLRELLLHQPMHADTETLLMFAARREHLAQVIEPALALGEYVICDRFTDATFAYQGGGRKLALERLAILEQWVHPNLQPDLTLLFDVPTKVARDRLDQQRAELDKFESEQASFFAAVRDGYLQRAAQFAQRFCIIDSTQAIDAIQLNLRQLLATIQSEQS